MRIHARGSCAHFGTMSDGRAEVRCLSCFGMVRLGFRVGYRGRSRFAWDRDKQSN